MRAAPSKRLSWSQLIDGQSRVAPCTLRLFPQTPVDLAKGLVDKAIDML